MAYQSAAEAAQAVAKGETQFAVSHQSQIQETYQQGSVTVVCAFDEGPIENGPFAGVEGVAAAESANNAVTGATLIPLLTLGIPCAMVRQDRGGGAVPEGLMAACGDWAGRKRMMRDGPRKREPPAGVCAGGWFKVS